MKKLLNAFMSIVSFILITIGILAVILFAIPTIVGYKPFVVVSGSMEPQIKVGAIAYNNTREKVEDVKVGDVIVFKADKSFVTHRVVKINDNKTFTTKGDANETEDLAPVKFENFKGKTAFSIPYLGKLLKLVQTRIGVFILVSAVGLNIVYSIFSSDEDNKKKQKNKKESSDNQKDNKDKKDNKDNKAKHINNHEKMEA